MFRAIKGSSTCFFNYAWLYHKEVDIVADSKPADVHLIDIIPDSLNDSEHNSAAD